MVQGQQGGPQSHAFAFPHGILPVMPPNGQQIWGEPVSSSSTTATTSISSGAISIIDVFLKY